MKIENPHIIVDHPYTLLVVTLDGTTHRLTAEQKPTLSRHGIVAIPGHTAKLPDNRVVEGSNDPELFRTWLAFALDMGNGREYQGGLLDPQEVGPLYCAGTLRTTRG